nr:ribonuclease H-like domain-containing protein [Tanacetum cinerariifolium]
MDQDSAHMVAASKVLMLKPGEFEIWRMRIEQYIQMLDYALWKVIENDYKEIDRGYVAFGGNPKGGKITGKCTIKTDHLGKFDGKADEGSFVGYSLNSKAFRAFNSRTRIVEENLHIRFSESTPNVVGIRSNDYAGTTTSDNASQARKETEPVKYYTLLPLWTADPSFSQDPKSSHDDVRMEQYLTHTDYALWEVIINGDAPILITSVSNGVEAAIPLKTTTEKIAGRNELKAKNNTSSTNEAVNTAHNISATSLQGQTFASTYADDVMFSFFANQSNIPQLDNEDLEQIDTDDLEEMDLKWHVAIITMRVKKFIKKTRRNLNFNGKETFGFDKAKVECYNCHRRGHFARECRAPMNQETRNGDNTRRVVPIETHVNALVVTNGIGLDDFVFKSAISEHITSVHETETSTSKTSKERNKSFLTNYQEIYGGFVAFGGSPKGDLPFWLLALDYFISKDVFDMAWRWTNTANYIYYCYVNIDVPLNTTIRKALNEDTELPQTSVHIPNVLDEAVYEEWDDSVERATTTAASLDATQNSGAKKPRGVPLLRLGLRGQGSGLGDKLKADKEDQLGVHSTAKVLVDAAKKVNTYTRIRRAVSTGSEGISTASKIFSTTGESMPRIDRGNLVRLWDLVNERFSTTEPIYDKEKALRVELKRLFKPDNDDILWKLQRGNLVRLWDLVNEGFSTTEPIDDKEKALRVELKRLFKPDNDDILWKLQSYMYDPLRQKTEEGLESTEEPKDDEISQEDLKQMMMIVPMEEVYVEANWSNIQSLTRRGNLVRLWDLVNEGFSTTEPIDDKEKALRVELKRLFKPDNDDILLQSYMYDPLVWRLYDTCGVHHVSTERGHDIFKLVEKEYPLTQGLMIVMMANKR